MNWKRIKTYLIITLLIGNLTIISLLIFGGDGEEDFLDSTSDLTRMMNESGIYISISGNTIRDKIEVPLLNVRIGELDLASVRRFYPAYGFGNDYIYSLSKDYKLTIDLYGYSGPAIPADKSAGGENAAWDLADRLVGEEEKTYKFSYMTEKNGIYQIHYDEVYGDYPILDGYIRITTDGKTLIRLEKRVFEVEESGTVKLVPYKTALYRLYSAIEDKDLPIEFVKVDIVYKIEAMPEEGNVLTAEPFPYYRFMTENGTIYLIKAL